MEILFSVLSIVWILSYFFGLAYLVFVFLLTLGVFKKKPFQLKELEPKTQFSIVVPFRDEKDNLPNLLQSISKLNYPQILFEVILVDDDSNDCWKPEVGSWKFAIKIIKNKRKSNSPKKDAIDTAIELALHDWIITTDADCEVHPNWLKTLDNYIQQENKRMVASGVKYKNGSGFLFDFQNLDFLSLQGVTIGSFWLREPFLCNGANFAYKKTFFTEIGGFSGNENIASGDDVFLLQKAVKVNEETVGFCLHTDSIVITKSENSWSELFNQRVRWASKTKGYQSGIGKFIGLSVFVFNVIVIWNMINGLYVGFNFVEFTSDLDLDDILFFVVSAFGLLIFKMFYDLALVYKTSKLYNTSLQNYVPSAFVYPFFTTVVAVYSLFGGFDWKGRKFSK